ncbi:MAG: 50S ribosomal protein L31 [Candidatus Pacebacteria bacterium]|nr:50S ribosomal protein L31 [Candidatus Paceibacterota bacterium]
MKTDIHPKNYKIKVKCDCGAEYDIETTKEDFTKVEICKNCHPFFTGQGKTLDTAGRVDKFKKKWDAAKKK